MKLSKIIVFLLVVGISFLPVSLNAMQITDEGGVVSDENTTFCTNQYYNITAAAKTEAVVILDKKTSSVLHSTKIYDGIIPIIIPENTSEIVISETEIDSDGKENLASEKRTSLNFQPCGNEVKIEDYIYKAPIATFELNNNSLTVTNTDSSVVMNYQFLDAGTSSTLVSGDKIDVTEYDTIQYTETVGDVHNYFEIYLNKEANTYIVKDVDSFEVKSLAIDLLDMRFLWLGILFFVLFVVFTVIYRRKKKRYNRARSQDKLRRRGL